MTPEDKVPTRGVSTIAKLSELRKWRMPSSNASGYFPDPLLLSDRHAFCYYIYYNNALITFVQKPGVILARLSSKQL